MAEPRDLALAREAAAVTDEQVAPEASLIKPEPAEPVAPAAYAGPGAPESLAEAPPRGDADPQP